MNNKAKLRVFYAAGPGDIIKTYQHWKDGQEDPIIPGSPSSGLFYTVIKEEKAEAMVVSYCVHEGEIHEPPFDLYNLPKKAASGWKYHIEQIRYGFKLLKMIIKYKPDIAYIDDGTSEWFVWNVLFLLKIKVFAVFKCNLWPRFEPLTTKQKIFNFFNRGFFRRIQGIVTIAPFSIEQASIVAGKKVLGFQYLPLYSPETFSGIPPPDLTKKPFRVLYIGRIEQEKGIFDIIEVAKRLKAKHNNEIVFDFCGQGSQMEDLVNEIKTNNLQDTCFFYGYSNREELRQHLGNAHVIIAPSKKSCLEGFCTVVTEGVMAERPVVTSQVCPSFYTVTTSVEEARPDDIDDYENAILKLFNDKDLYIRKQKACEINSQQFFHKENSLKHMLKESIHLVRREIEKNPA